MAKISDVLIIGGGIAGVGAAARLSGSAKVTLLEREQALGYHATGRSAAIFILNYGNSTLRALNRASEPEFTSPDGISDCSLLSPRGELLLASEEELPRLEEYLTGATGIERLTPTEAQELVPILRKERLAAAALERDAREIDVDRLLQGYARLARSNGAEIVQTAPVGKIGRVGGCWQVETPKGMYAAPVLINAAGAWADEIAQLAGLRPLGLQPMRRSAAIIPAPEGCDVRHWPLFGDIAESFYAKPDAGRLMVSPGEEDPVAPQDAWADDMVLAEGLHRYEQAVSVPVTRVERSWAGLRTFAPDRTPVVGFSPEAEGFFWLAGQGGYGIQTAPALSALTASLVLGREPALPEAVAAALAPDRLTG